MQYRTCLLLLAISEAASLGSRLVRGSPSLSKPTVGLFVPLEAKPDKGPDVASFLLAGKALVDQEPQTVQWYGVKFNETEYAIFDTFPTTIGRDAHLNGKVAAALVANAPTLLTSGPEIDKIDILAAMVRPVSTAVNATLGLHVPLVAKPDQAETVKEFLLSALSLVRKEPLTLQWFAYQKSETEFGIFDTAATESGRQAHLNGKVAAALVQNADQWFAQPLDIQEFDILALKIVI